MGAPPQCPSRAGKEAHPWGTEESQGCKMSLCLPWGTQGFLLPGGEAGADALKPGGGWLKQGGCEGHRAQVVKGSEVKGSEAGELEAAACDWQEGAMD